MFDIGQRKRASQGIYDLGMLLKKLDEHKKEIIRLSSEQSYKMQVKAFEGEKEKLEALIKTQPTGHRYTGTFYVKDTYKTPVVYEKVEGSIFMREDLIKWQIEGKLDRVWGYPHAVFKDDKGRAIFEREDGQPVYESDTQEVETNESCHTAS